MPLMEEKAYAGMNQKHIGFAYIAWELQVFKQNGKFILHLLHVLDSNQHRSFMHCVCELNKVSNVTLSFVLLII